MSLSWSQFFCNMIMLMEIRAGITKIENHEKIMFGMLWIIKKGN